MLSSRRDFWIKLTAAALVGAVIVAFMPLDRMAKAQNDFVHWYVGGLLFGTPDIHLQAPNHAKQAELLGSTLDHSYFIRPTFYGFFLKPLTWLPYLTSYYLYQAYSLAALLYFLWVLGKRWPDIWVYAALSIPAISHMINGQDVTSLLLFCTLSLLLSRRQRDFAAGLVFALCAIKFHLFIFVPLAIVAHRRWRLFAGAAVGEIILFLIGLAGGGWLVFLSLIALLRHPENHPYPELMPNLRGMVYALNGGPNTPLLVAIYLLVGTTAAYLVWNARTYEKSFGYALMAGLVINFHAYIQDPMLLLLCCALLFDGEETLVFRSVMQLLLFPVVYLLLLWQPPFSGLYGLLIIAAFAVALRDQLQAAPTALRGFRTLIPCAASLPSSFLPVSLSPNPNPQRPFLSSQVANSTSKPTKQLG